MDIFLLFLPLSSETTRGFISQASSCRARWAGGNSFQMSSVLLKRSPAVHKTACSPQPRHTQPRRAPRPGCAPKSRAPARSPGAAVEHTEPERTAQGSAPGRPQALQGERRAPFGKPARLAPRGAAPAPPAPLSGPEPPVPARGAARCPHTARPGAPRGRSLLPPPAEARGAGADPCKRHSPAGTWVCHLPSFN